MAIVIDVLRASTTINTLLQLCNEVYITDSIEKANSYENAIKIGERHGKKIEEFDGLINEEGAISLIAKEMGIEFDSDEEDYEFTINDITEGQRNVEVTGRIMNISEIRTFSLLAMLSLKTSDVVCYR